MKSALFGVTSSLLLTLGISSISSIAEAHTGTLPPIPSALMDYIEAGSDFPDPLDPSYTTLWVAGGRNTFIATGEDTGGQYSLFDLFVPPDVGPPLHLHQREDEWFYVVEGNPSFQMEDHTLTGGPGTFVYGPRNELHTFRNLTNTPVRMILFYQPSGIENFFTDVGQTVTDPFTPPAFNPAELLEAGPRYGLEFPSTFIFAAPEYNVNDGVTVIRTGVPDEEVGVSIALSDGSVIPLTFAIGESVQAVSISPTQGNNSVNLTLQNPTNGAYIGLLQNTAIVTSPASVPESSFPLGLLAFSGLGTSLLLKRKQNSLSQVGQLINQSTPNSSGIAGANI